MNQKCIKNNQRRRRVVFPSKSPSITLALSRVFMVSNNALHSGYSVCRTYARLQGHVHIAGYRLLFIGPCVAAGADAGRDAAQRAPRRSQEQVSINSNECAWFVRETAFNFRSDTIWTSAKYDEPSTFSRILWVKRTGCNA